MRARAQQLIDALPSIDEIIGLAVADFGDDIGQDSLAMILNYLPDVCDLLEQLLNQQRLQMPPPSTSQFDDVREQQELHRLIRILSREEFLPRLRLILKSLIIRLTAEYIPFHKSSLSSNYLNAIHPFPEFVQSLFDPIFDPATIRLNVLEDLHEQLSRNIKRASSGSSRLLWPKHSELPPRELFSAYCGGTPLMRLARFRKPFVIPRPVLNEHCAIFAPSGHGKSELLKALVHDILKYPVLEQRNGYKAYAPPPAMFVLDSHGDLVRALAPIVPPDRLHIIDPEVRAPKLNFFALDGNDRLFAYIFSALDREFTAKQSTTVLFILRLMQKLPSPTLLTLLEIMQDRSKSIAESKFATTIKSLDPVAQSFFATQYFTRDQMATRLQVANRIYTLLANSTFQEMFTASTNEFAPDALMRANKIVLVNTSYQKLGEASSVFGRYVIACVLNAGSVQNISHF